MKKQKSLPQLKKELQVVFNKYIRQRDEGLPCISCGNYISNCQAGHYFSVKGYDGLRFDEDNVHAECEYDNCFNESHLIGYGINLKARIGEDKYNALLERAADYKRIGYKFSRTELIEKIAYYKKLITNNT
jgi:hypothetical protein